MPGRHPATRIDQGREITGSNVYLLRTVTGHLPNVDSFVIHVSFLSTCCIIVWEVLKTTEIWIQGQDETDMITRER